MAANPDHIMLPAYHCNARACMADSQLAEDKPSETFCRAGPTFCKRAPTLNVPPASQVKSQGWSLEDEGVSFTCLYAPLWILLQENASTQPQYGHLQLSHARRDLGGSFSGTGPAEVIRTTDLVSTSPGSCTALSTLSTPFLEDLLHRLTPS